MLRSMNRSILIFIVIIAALAAGCDKRQGRLKLLTGDESLKEFYSIEPDSVTMYASPGDRKAGRIECRLYEDEYDIFIKMFRVLDYPAIEEAYRAKGASRFRSDFINKIRSLDAKRYRPGLNPAHPLAGLRVAIDPGHSAGSMNEAIRESKYMWIFTPDGRRLKFYESQLNLATARFLKELLEKDGATVMLTRDENRQVFPVPYDQWVRRDFRRAVREKQRDGHITAAEASRLLYYSGDRGRLKFFNSEYEMPYRARLINEFHPHITVLAHYDANDDDTAYRSKYLRIKEIMSRPGAGDKRMEDIREVVDSIAELQKNFCTVFIPGCFLGGELDSIESRVEFLRLVVSPDLENSARYSKYVIENFEKILKVPASDESFPGSFHAGFFRDGIYARNFRMTRLVHGTLCLGEPLQQNNLKEAVLLAEISGGTVPERVKAVARAYYRAIRKYAGMNMPD
jgi:hypothetical protein